MLDGFIEQRRESRLETYRRIPDDIEDHFNGEEIVLGGGYGYRQILELVQNGADAILEDDESLPGPRLDDRSRRIHVLFDGERLYVANTGAPLSQEGIKALLLANSSPKRGNQIGRFGIGFKSLLRLGGMIDIFSQGVSLRFDPERCRATIREACGLAADHPAPALRLAWTLERKSEVGKDPRLSDFAWATTVVRAEVKNPAMPEHISQEIREFPSRFLLFLPSAIDLDLTLPEGETRRLSRSLDGDALKLTDGDGVSRWRLIEREVRITDPAALEDALGIHRRAAVPLVWAIPLDTRRDEPGSFWAFFPTKTQSRVPGILNAPWKLHTDRQAIIEGDWNRALMREAAEMIAETLPSLADPSDPGRILDYFPRQLDPKDEPAASLVGALWTRIAEAAVVPDGSGVLRPGSELRRPPIDDETLVERWCKLASAAALTRWIHSSCLNRERNARLTELARRLGQSVPSSGSVPEVPRLAVAKASDWFAEVASTEVDAAKAVLALARDFCQSLKNSDWIVIRSTLGIVPSRDGALCRGDQILIARPDQNLPGQRFVADAFVSDEMTRAILDGTLNIRSLLDDNWRPIIDKALRDAVASPSDESWHAFWQVLRCASDKDRLKIASEHAQEIRVRRLDGTWQYADAVLLPGAIVAADDSEQPMGKILIDLAFHRDDAASLQAVGVHDIPTCRLSDARIHLASDWGYKFRQDIVQALSQWSDAAWAPFRKLSGSSRPNRSSCFPELSMPAGFVLLPHLVGLANARLTHRLLHIVRSCPEIVTLKHYKSPQRYPIQDIEHPLRWLVRRHGCVAIGDGALSVAVVLMRIESPVIRRLDSLRDAMPVLDSLARQAPASRRDADALKRLWQALGKHLATWPAVEAGALTDLWNGAAADGWVPDTLPGPNGEIPLAEVYVTGSADLARRARARGWVAVELDELALDQWREKGARGLEDQFRVGWLEPLAAVGLLEDILPEMGAVLAEAAKGETYAQPVRGLHLGVDDQDEAIACVHWEGVLYLDPVQLDPLSPQDRLRRILKEAATAGWLRCDPVQALSLIADATLESRRAEVAAGTDLADRLLRAVGQDLDALRLALGESACRALPKNPAPSDVARLAVDLLGPTVLQAPAIATALDAADLRPPARWGTAEARAFVLGLGFPEIYGEAGGSRPDPEILVSGPIPLPPLHTEYQVPVLDGLAALLAGGTGRRRAVVSLPTGGGKTRVTVQAAVELVLKPAGPRRTVLWVAQTGELCEQAVQSFRQVWLNLGAEGQDLRIVRFWGGHANPGAPTGDEPTVVVASIQTLNSRIGADSLAWLSTPGLVVVDECHHAITKSYTSLLRWLDAEAPRPGAVARDEPPFIGLSATPFRMDDEESVRLAKRFDRRWLPPDQAGLYELLLRGEFLARAEHVPLRTGETVPADLIADLDALWDTLEDARFNGALERVNSALAQNAERNRRLIDAIQATEAQQILFFANSVDHATEIAARLCLLGIPAGAVSGDTLPTARRWFLSRFRSGDLRVLCNYKVLATGFDAPKTDLVLIARQVKSPVSYMQMVGRGLRGPRNGGTAACRILTVLDNLGRFSDRHPFHYCSDLYAGS